MRLILCFVALFLILPVQATEFRFADRDTAVAILTDESTGYFARMSAADPTVRLLSETPKTVADLKAAYARGTRHFTPQERQDLEAILASEAANLAALAPWLPEQVVFVAVTDQVEGGLPHTRANAIVFPTGSLDNSEGRLQLFYHELFHVISRAHSANHEPLYGLINFTRCSEIAIPDPYAARLITNPDAPVNNYWVPVRADGEAIKVIPMLYAVSKTFNPRRGKGFGSQFRLGFLEVQTDAAGRCTLVSGRDGTASVHQPNQIAGLNEAAGGNTQYIIHPEEILADNFALLMTGTSVRDAWVLDRLRDYLGLPADMDLAPAIAEDRPEPVTNTP